VHDPHHSRVGPLCFIDHLVLPIDGLYGEDRTREY